MPVEVLFTAEDFDLFTPDKWSDLSYNLQRKDLKSRLKALAEAVMNRIELPNLIMELGVEYPAIWNGKKVDRLEAFFMRPEDERSMLERVMVKEISISQQLMAPSTLYSHASVGFHMDSTGIHVGFRIPLLAVGDMANARKALEVKTDSVINTFRSLKNEFYAQSGANTHEVVWDTLQDLSSVKEMLTPADETSVDSRKRSLFGLLVSISRSDIEEGLESERLVEKLAEYMDSVIPVYKILAWSPDNDLIDVRGLWHRMEEQRKQEEERRRLEEEKKRLEEEQRKKQEEERLRARHKKFSRKPHRKDHAQSGGRRPHSDRQDTASSVRDRKRKKRRGGSQESAGTSFGQKAQGVELTTGMRVKVINGPFKGKTATVQQLMGDKAKIHLGLFEVEISTEDLMW